MTHKQGAIVFFSFLFLLFGHAFEKNTAFFLFFIYFYIHF